MLDLHDSSCTPLATALQAVAGRGRCHNFHALPWADALDEAGSELGELYDTLLGRGLAGADVPLSGRALDSFLEPRGPLNRAQLLAAGAFAADATFFVSCGTSVANRVVFDAFRSPSATALVDATSHHSLVVGAAAAGFDVSYTPTVVRDGVAHADIAATAALLAERRAAGRPFDVLALTGASYEGHRLRLDLVLPLAASASPETVVFVDEAWSAIHTFSPPLAAHSTLPVARKMARSGAVVPTVVVTQSAHKTMNALRQGSYLHVAGPAAVIAALQDAVVRNHTTSPSWPILASLDLARAHAVQQGRGAVERALKLKELFTEILLADSRTSWLLPEGGDAASDEFYLADQMRLTLRCGTRADAGALRDWLYHEHNIYLPRPGPRGLVAHFHIGVSEPDVRALAAALTEWVQAPRLAARPPDRTDPAVGAILADYVVPYPPGVPIARPGDTWTRQHSELLAAERASGADVVRIRTP